MNFFKLFLLSLIVFVFNNNAFAADAAKGKKSSWREDVPECIIKVIEDEWKTVEKYASAEDMTRRVVGMKFPKEGWSKK